MRLILTIAAIVGAYLFAKKCFCNEESSSIDIRHPLTGLFEDSKKKAGNFQDDRLASPVFRPVVSVPTVRPKAPVIVASRPRISFGTGSTAPNQPTSVGW